MSAREFVVSVLPLRIRIEGYARSLLKSEAGAEDVCQEVLLRLWTRRVELSSVHNLAGYAMRMTRNLCLDGLSRPDARAAELATEPPAQTRGPEERYLASEALAGVLELTRAMPERQRRVLLLRDAMGCTFDEIARATGARPVTVRVTLSRARRRLRDLTRERQP